MENLKQTIGQCRVKAEFNPTKNNTVDIIKNKSAELIDILESMKSVNAITDEKSRLLEKAQMDIEIACMLAVKANFTN